MNKYIIIGQQIAGPIHDKAVGYTKEHLDKLPSYDIPPELQEKWKGRTEVRKGVDFNIVFVTPMPFPDQHKMDPSHPDYARMAAQQKRGWQVVAVSERTI